jgi:hypothetical protein
MAMIRAQWGPLTSALVETCRLQIEALVKASPEEDWLAALLRDQPASRELYRDAVHGFVLLAHVEKTGLYRSPHDHGRARVIYGVQQGESEMGTYGRVEAPDGHAHLVKRNATGQPG